MKGKPVATPEWGYEYGEDGGPILLGTSESRRTYRGWILENTAYPQNKTTVALKQFAGGTGEDDLRANRASWTELEILNGLEHPHMVNHLRRFEGPGIHVLATEFIAGESLHEASVNRDSTRSAGGGDDEELWFGKVARWGYQVSLAIQYLEKAGIVHFDVKPGNIMIQSEGELAKLIDFGLAVRIDAIGERLKRSRTFGTVPFACPAISLASDTGDGDALTLGSKSDLYGLGMSLAFALCPGAFLGGDWSDCGRRDLVEELHGLPESASSLVRVIERLIEEDPGERPDASEATGLLEEVARNLGEEVAFRTNDPIYPAPGGMPEFVRIGDGGEIAHTLLTVALARELFRAGAAGARLDDASRPYQCSFDYALELIDLINHRESGKGYSYRLPMESEWVECQGPAGRMPGTIPARQCPFLDSKAAHWEWMGDECAEFPECRHVMYPADDGTVAQEIRHTLWPKGCVRLVRVRS